MEYNFSVTRRMLTLFFLCSCLLVACVFFLGFEFGKKIKAKSLLAGGESGDPSSKHFKDQAGMYTKGEFKDVLFYKEDIMLHKESEYHPGEGIINGVKAAGRVRK